jgi:hypothetical protein
LNSAHEFFIELPSISSDLALESFEYPVPDGNWYHDPVADISVAKIEVDAIGRPVRLAAIGRGYLYDGRAGHFRHNLLTCDVRLVGLWQERQNGSVILIRRGVLAAPKAVKVSLDVGGGVFATNEVYLVDAAVTKAMSGGPVFLTNGEGTSENALLGVIHGYWYLGRRLTYEDLETLPEEVGNVLRVMPLINGNLAYVVTSSELDRVIKAAIASD